MTIHTKPLDTSPYFIILGSQGQLGSDVLLQCRQQQVDYLALDFPDIDLSQKNITVTLSQILQNAGLDLGSKSFMLINCAAYTAVDKAQTENDLAYAINAEGPGRLALFCQQNEIDLIHISTDYVFNGQSNKPYQEDDPCQPLGVYGASKRQGECLVKENKPQSIILRTSWLYGLHGQNFVKTMLRLMAEKQSLSVVSDQLGCPTWSKDLAQAIMAICLNGQRLSQARGELYHFSNKGVTSWHNFADNILENARHIGKAKLSCQWVDAIVSSAYPTPSPRPAYSAFSLAKISQLLDYEPPYWKDSLRQFLRLLYLP